jgi:hypothetical protein
MIKDFKARFSDAKYNAISRPEDTNGLCTIYIFRREDMDTLYLENTTVFFPAGMQACASQTHPSPV